MPGIEFLGDGTNSMTVGGIVIDGVYQVDEQGGQQAPEKKVQEGYDFTTRVGPEPLTATISAWTDADTYEALTSLRTTREPFPVSIGSVSLEAVALEDLRVNATGTHAGAYDISIDIRQVQQASSGTAIVKVTSTTGTKTSGAGQSPTDGSGPVAVPSTGIGSPQTPDTVTTGTTTVLSPPDNAPVSTSDTASEAAGGAGGGV